MLATAKIAPRPAHAGAAGTALRIVAPYLMAAYIAYILGWYLPFKFAPESYLFQVLEDWAGRDWVEPYFRYLTGTVEGLTVVLLFVPGLQVLGAGMAFVTMASAISLHLFTPLGVDPYNDGGTLFKEAIANLVLSAAILVIRRHEILPLARLFLSDPRLARGGGRG